MPNNERPINSTENGENIKENSTSWQSKAKTFFLQFNLYNIFIIFVSIVLLIATVYYLQGLFSHPIASVKKEKAVLKCSTCTNNKNGSKSHCCSMCNKDIGCSKNGKCIDNICDCGYGYFVDQHSNCHKCGLEFNSTSYRIIGGQVAKTSRWSSVVMIGIDNRFLCTGLLIHIRYVLTALHCVSNDEIDNPTIPIERIRVKAGVFSWDKALNQSGLRVEKIIPYPEKSIIQNKNDIALIKLTENVRLNRNIQIACLPDMVSKKYIKYPEESHEFGIAVGWGLTSKNDSHPQELMETNIDLLDSKLCEYLDIDEAIHICAGKLDGSTDTCNGDSGGPLFVKESFDDNDRFVLAGILSSGYIECGTPEKPSVYVRIAEKENLDWIKKTIREW